MIIVKVGGSEGIDHQALCQDIADIWTGSLKLVLVHGGSALTNDLATALEHPPRFVTSPSGFTSRFTDRRTMEIFMMGYCGQQNKCLVERLQALGVNAVGLSGLDGGLWRGRQKQVTKVVENGRTLLLRDNLTGRVEQVNTALLQQLLEAGYLPVITPPALSHEGWAINVDGDRAAAATAVALRAHELLLLSNIPGLLQEFPDEASLIQHLTPEQLMEAQQWASGRMKIKLLGAREALDGGVARVILGDARIARPVSLALEGHGTVMGGLDHG